MSSDVKAIHVDVNSWELAKNFPIDIGMIADPKVGLKDVGDEVKQRLNTMHRQATEQRMTQIKKAKDELTAHLEDEARGWAKLPALHVGRVVTELRNMLIGLPDLKKGVCSECRGPSPMPMSQSRMIAGFPPFAVSVTASAPFFVTSLMAS